jgi:hypothetical protein
MAQPQIVIQDFEGIHNKSDYITRLEKARSYEDLSTICIIPTRGVIPAKVVQNWLTMMTPMNQKFTRIFMIGMEVGAAYSSAIDMILAHPELSKWRYVVTLEEDNTIPPDALLKLLEDGEQWDALGALYWTKGEAGQPMCYGKHGSLDFVPQIPQPDTVTQCNGLGMGFTLFKMEFLRKMKEKFPDKPLFETRQVYQPGQGAQAFTQDLYFFHNALSIGAKVGCSSKVKVGHYDINSDIVW